jgi:hypothetical protein
MTLHPDKFNPEAAKQALLHELAMLRADPRRFEVIETMARACNDKDYQVAMVLGQPADVKPWPSLSEDFRNVYRLGMMAAMKAAQELKARRAENV